MDLYPFRALPGIETGNEADCLIYYLELGYLEFDHMHGRAIAGSSNHLEKMLKPLKVHTIQVHSPDDARHTLAEDNGRSGKEIKLTTAIHGQENSYESLTFLVQSRRK